MAPDQGGLPPPVATFLDEADERIRTHIQRVARRPRGFVASDFITVHAALSRVLEEGLCSGSRFCEWGSGFGVVTALAAMLQLEAYGIELQPELVEEATSLAEDFDLDVEFAAGSFIPPDCRAAAEADDYAWSDEGDPCGYDELDLTPEDFDLIFSYPWPGEEDVIDGVFAACAATGALLLTYHGVSGLRLQRKLEDGSLEAFEDWE